MNRKSKTESSPPNSEVAELRARLEEAEATLDALRNGELDALVIGERLYMLESAETASNRLRGDALALVHDAVIVVDNDKRVTYLNPAAERQYGVTADDILGLALDELFESRWLNQEDEARLAKLSDANAWRSENIHVKRDGQLLYVESSVSVLRDISETVTGRLAIIRDITERKEAEIAVRRSEANLRDFLENASVGMHWVDANGLILWANRTELEMLGYAREEYIGHHIAEFHVDPDVIADILTRLQRGETLQNYEARLRHRNGSVRYGSINSNVLWEDGKFVHTRCFTRDTTERKQAEATLRESENRLRKAIAESPFPTIIHDEDDQILAVSKGWTHYSGYTIADIPTITAWTERAYGERQAFVKDYIDQLFEADQTVANGEWTINAKDGQPHIWDFYTTPLGQTVGGVRLLLSIAADVTARKQAEAQLRESDELNRSLIDGSTDCVKVLDTDGRLLLINAAGLSLMEIDDFGLVGERDWASLWPPETSEVVHRAVERARGGETSSFEAFCPTAKGTPKWWDVTLSPVRATPGGAIVRLLGVSRDITERKRGAAQLALLAQISDELARLSTTDEIMQSIGAKIGEFLRVSHCLFAEIDEARDSVNIETAWRGTGMAEVVGVYQLSEFVTEAFREAARAGETIVVRDTQTDPRTDVAGYGAYNIHSFITVPFTRGGEWKYLFTINDSAVRDWHTDEIELVREIMGRVFVRLERARAEIALQASHAELSRFNRVAVGRELRMIKLKKEVNELCDRLGQRPRYALEFDKAGGSTQ